MRNLCYGTFSAEIYLRILNVRVRRDGYPLKEEDAFVMEERVKGGNVWVLSDFWVQKLQAFVGAQYALAVSCSTDCQAQKV